MIQNADQLKCVEPTEIKIMARKMSLQKCLNLAFLLEDCVDEVEFEDKDADEKNRE